MRRFFIGDYFGEEKPPPSGEALDIELPPGRYVALGDSYSAGEGLAPFQAGTEDVGQGSDRCHRSNQHAYPLLLDFAPPRRKLFRACSGGRAELVFEEVQEHDPQMAGEADAA